MPELQFHRPDQRALYDFIEKKANSNPDHVAVLTYKEIHGKGAYQMGRYGVLLNIKYLLFHKIIRKTKAKKYNKSKHAYEIARHWK